VYISPETTAIISYNTKVGMWTLESLLLIESFVASSFVFPPKTGWTNNLNISGNLIPKLVLLRGSNTTVYINVIQTGNIGSFENVVYSKSTPDVLNEVQQIKLSAATSNFGCFFFISFGSNDQQVRVNSNDSAQDLASKLSSLRQSGPVEVTRSTSLNAIVWSVTFSSYVGDVDELKINNLTNIFGTDVSFSVIEKVKGSEILSHVVANNLSRDNTYVARMAALNAAGVGKYSSILQRKGQGIKPFFLIPKSVPEQPSISLSTLSSSQIAVNFDIKDKKKVDLYKIEWTSDNNFGSKEIIKMSIKSNEYNLAGSFKFVVSHNALDIVESSIPISILSSHLEITAALKHISFIGDITVQTTVNNSRFIE